MKKILILANIDMGLYNFRKELLETLLQKGYEVYISLPKGPRVKDMEQMGCKFIETPVDRRGMNPIADLKLFFKYRKIILFYKSKKLHKRDFARKGELYEKGNKSFNIVYYCLWCSTFCLW